MIFCHKHKEEKDFGLQNKYDAYHKCIDIIKSCKTYQQWLTAFEIPYMFYDLYEDFKLMSDLCIEHSNIAIHFDTDDRYYKCT